MRFQKGLFYQHKNSVDLIIEILWSGKYENYHKLKIAYWNISPRDQDPWPIGIKETVRIIHKNVHNWSIYKPYPIRGYDANVSHL